MLSVQKKMDYRSRGIANGDTGDKTGVSSPNLFSLKKTDIKLAFINRSIRRFEWEKKLKVRPNARIKVGQICICPNFTEHESGKSIALTQRNDRAFLHDLEKRTFVWLATKRNYATRGETGEKFPSDSYAFYYSANIKK